MADTTRFGHDNLGHILLDRLLQVPRFQRRYSWESHHVVEFLDDLEGARSKGVNYFMGTVVFSRQPDQPRQQIVDGQQRIATTAILYLAIRDELKSAGEVRLSDELEKRFLRGYVLSEKAELERLILNGDDMISYGCLLDSQQSVRQDRISDAYQTCRSRLHASMKNDGVEALLDVSSQLETQVQVLVAEASNLPEAYVIFETLNDRGADLTTADLLKNYLFSSAGSYFNFIEEKWLEIESAFEKSSDLVKFIRFEYASRKSYTTNRRLYREIQGEIGGSAAKCKEYVQRLSQAHRVYLALQDSDSSFWNNSKSDVGDALSAFRRFQFETSIPILLAAWSAWDRNDFDRIVPKIANWSIRAQIAGNLGTTADEVFGATAKAVTEGKIVNQVQLRDSLGSVVPSDPELIEAFIAYGDIPTSRAKYLLAMLEKAHAQKNNQVPPVVDWTSRGVTIEHILPRSQAASSSGVTFVHRIGNLALLEKRLNRRAGSKPFVDRKDVYRYSSFALTSKLTSKRGWTQRNIAQRTRELSELSVLAWPNS